MCLTCHQVGGLWGSSYIRRAGMEPRSSFSSPAMVSRASAASAGVKINSCRFTLLTVFPVLVSLWCSESRIEGEFQSVARTVEEFGRHREHFRRQLSSLGCPYR